MTINISCPHPHCRASNRLRGASKEATTIHRITCRRCKEKMQVKAEPKRLSFGIAHTCTNTGI